MQVMHSDLKTKNVLLTKDHVTAKIADVGLSQFLDHQTNQPNIIACERCSRKQKATCFKAVVVQAFHCTAMHWTSCEADRADSIVCSLCRDIVSAKTLLLNTSVDLAAWFLLRCSQFIFVHEV